MAKHVHRSIALRRHHQPAQSLVVSEMKAGLLADRPPSRSYELPRLGCPLVAPMQRRKTIGRFRRRRNEGAAAASENATANPKC